MKNYCFLALAHDSTRRILLPEATEPGGAALTGLPPRVPDHASLPPWNIRNAGKHFTPYLSAVPWCSPKSTLTIWYFSLSEDCGGAAVADVAPLPVGLVADAHSAWDVLPPPSSTPPATADPRRRKELASSAARSTGLHMGSSPRTHTTATSWSGAVSSSRKIPSLCGWKKKGAGRDEEGPDSERILAK